AALASGYYATPLAQGGTSSFWTQGDGAAVSAGVCATTTPFSWQSCSASVGTKYSHDNSNAQFVIELLSAVSSGGSTTSNYRITSRSKGGSGNADVVLQTNYSRTTTP
ncbi:MAG: Type pilus assembly protein PilX C-term, partial [Pseudomonadota bacterium]